MKRREYLKGADIVFEENRGKEEKPSHYNANPKLDVYSFALENNLGPLEFNIVKYVTRYKKKGGLKDLNKALDTLQRLIKHVEENGND